MNNTTKSTSAGTRGKKPTCQCRKQETLVQSLGPEISWRRKWQPTPVFLPGESHGQKSLASYSPWGHKRFRHHCSSRYLASMDNLFSSNCLLYLLSLNRYHHQQIFIRHLLYDRNFMHYLYLLRTLLI